MTKSIWLILFLFSLSFNTHAGLNTQSPSLKIFLKNFSKDAFNTFLKKPYSDSEPRKQKLSGLNKAVIGREDNVRFLVEPSLRKLVKNIYAIKDNQIGSSKLQPTYWTGYWWSTSNGLLGARFGERSFSSIFEWQDKYNYVQSKPISTYIEKDLVRKLSPSEKYDLLVGDPNFALTKYMWNRGKRSMQSYGEIFYWDGLCDGLASAAVSLPRPAKAITLYSRDGKIPIKFYPEDIKALGSFIYTRSRPPYRMIGTRCDNRLPEIDENGRFISKNCFNVNPGAFHLALVNQIGRAKRSFSMDSVSADEVWNYPLVGYSFKYFNPETLEEVEDLKKGIINYGEFTKDKFSKYRSKKVAKIVGVQADITFLKDRMPVFKDTETDEHNKPGVVIYRYDLELDQEGNILGGEWYHGHHPDFLWVTDKNQGPEGPYDDEIKVGWDPKKELIPSQWAEVAIKSSQVGKVPAQLVEALFKMAKEGADGINPNKID